jgi:hypothetical protein
MQRQAKLGTKHEMKTNKTKNSTQKSKMMSNTQIENESLSNTMHNV